MIPIWMMIGPIGILCPARTQLGLIRGNAVYHGEHLKEVSRLVELNKNVLITGGAAKIKGYLDVKKRWTGDFEYEFQDQSSLLGAAKLVGFYRSKQYV